MPKVTLPDGTIINFTNPPTQQDIKEAQEQIFAQKMAENAPPPVAPAEAKPSFMSNLKTFLGGEITGAPVKSGILGDIFQQTIGSKGVLGALQLPGKVLGQSGLYKDIEGLAQSQTNLADMTTKLIKKKKTLTNPEQIKKYNALIKDNLEQMKGMGISMSDLENRTITPKEALATTARAGLTLLPFAKVGGVNVMQQLAKPLETAMGVQPFGMGGLGGAATRVGARAIESAVPAGLFGGATAFGEEKTAGEIAKTAASYGLTGAIFGGLLQSGAESIKAVSDALKGRGIGIQMSKIKPPKDVNPQEFKEALTKYKLYGPASDVVEKSEAQLADLNYQLNQNLTGTEKKINLGDLFDEVKSRMVRDRLENVGLGRPMERVVMDAEKEIMNAYGNTVDLSQANALKRATGGLGAWEFGRADPDAPAKAKVWSYIYSELRRTIENVSGVPEEVQAINREMSRIIPVRDAAIRALPAQVKASTLSLPDFIGALASLHDPYAAALTAANMASKSPGALIGVGEAFGKLAPQPTARTGALAPAIMARMGQRTIEGENQRQRMRDLLKQTYGEGFGMQ